MEHIGKLPGCLRRVAFDGVGQGVHTGRSGKALGHGRHHVGIDYGVSGDVVLVNADELALPVRIRDDVIDGNFSSGAGRRGNGDGLYGMILRGSYALEGKHVTELGICNDDADGLGCVHGRATTDGDDRVSVGCLESSHAVLDVLNRGIGLDFGIYAVGNLCLVEKVRDLGGDAELDEVGVGAYEDLREALALSDSGYFLDGPLAMVGYGVQNDSVCHLFVSSFNEIENRKELFPSTFLTISVSQWEVKSCFFKKNCPLLQV